jgi:crotonobetainyl-CoA:carnitine CoA-transferase CaiB-like acyl-CoA transferase
MAEGALKAFRVLDLSGHIAGPFAAKLMGDYGADVIKIEPPGVGDVSRRMGPFHEDDPHPEKSLLFFYLNCNKRGVTLNLESSAGRRLFREMVKKADAVIEDFRPGYLERLRLGFEELEKINPNLVVTSVTPFGQKGPYSQYKGSHLVYESMGGIMYTSGAYSREPLAHGHPQSLYIGGITAAYVTLGALWARSTCRCERWRRRTMAARRAGTRTQGSSNVERRSTSRGAPRAGRTWRGYRR